MMSPIVQKDDPALRARAKAVPASEIQSPATRRLLAKMSRALAEQDDGVALAAPQIGESKRIFIISGRVVNTADQITADKKPARDLIFINPRLVKASRQKTEMEEGCLSMRWLYGLTRRSTKASVEAYDEHGHKFIRHGTGLIAQIFQHELDHLEGILFTDHATKIREMKPEK